MQTQKLCEGVDLRVIDGQKFKTNLVSLFFNIPLRRDTITKAALLPAVLKRGSANFPRFTDMARHLEEMYNAVCSAGVRMKGDGEVLYFSVEYISDRYIGENLTRDIVSFLKEFVFLPLVENNGFKPDYVTSEKENLRNAILSLINDKKEYADVKCRELMFGSQGYGMFEAGYVEDLEDITPENLYAFYQDVLHNAKADIFVSGHVEQETCKVVRDILADCLPPRSASYISTEVALPENKEIRMVTEEIDVVQSKISMGLRCGVPSASSEYYALMLGSCIFGGSPFSKLFNNVREKLSLAYYAVARTERFKSVMMISSGIETENFRAAYDEIMVQFAKMQQGDFSEEEIEAAKKYLTTGLCSMKDSLRSMEDYFLSQAILGMNQDVDDLLDAILHVEKEQIVQVMQKVTFDTVFFLKGKNMEGGQNEDGNTI